jgi:hypothetical protein
MKYVEGAEMSRYPRHTGGKRQEEEWGGAKIWI